jgi:hypothetical protein
MKITASCSRQSSSTGDTRIMAIATGASAVLALAIRAMTVGLIGGERR